VIVASYDVIRNDIDYIVAEMDFNYCVLDEGHIIKNAKSKMTMAVKQIRANHRLILSGTPIQNNVLELWSLFDFLMPGFLGTERQFNDRFSKPILAMKGKYIGSGGGSSGKKINPAAAAKIQEAGTLALEALHRQVLPFLLRRVKEQVMDDLPPKIIQDYYCEMSDLQRMIYNDFVRNQAAALGIADLEASGEKKGGGAGHHIFQALQYMRKVCNHPALVMTDPQDPLYADVQQQCERQKMNLRDVRHSPKLLALKDLLQNCGIGVAGAESKPDDGAASSAEDAITTATVSQHRALIFCQLRPMVEFIEQDLFKNHMPDVSYLRLDGSTSPSDRHNIAQRFNSDPSIDVLLLTTNVGGLGLNLTGADTVIFVEHDWNPMKDLQAMDRAHRIGQKRVVNVYRLITKDTLEEKIMGLQRFKLNIANTVISEENSGGGFKSMRSEEILDLFGSSASTAAEASGRKRSRQAGDDEVEAGLKRAKVGGVAGLSQDIMEQLDLLTAQSAEQYESELDFNKFMERLHGK
jgi:TATA-binding protein-associated factor